MDFSIPDLLSPAAGSPADMGGRPTRSTTPSSSSGSRKSFSTVFQGVREDGRRTETRSVDDGRSTNKTDHKTRSMDTKEQSSSPDHGERTDGPASYARGADENRSNEAAEEEPKDSGTDLAVSTEQSRGGSDVQGRTSESLSPVISPQAVAQAITRTDVRTEGEDLSALEEPADPGPHASEPHSESRIGLFSPRTDSTGIPSGSLTRPDSVGVSVRSDAQGSAQPTVPPTAPDPPVIRAGNGTVPVPAGKPGFPVTGEASTSEVTTPLEARPVPPDSPLRSTGSHMDAIGSGSAPVQSETVVPGGKPEIAKTDLMFREGVPFDRRPLPETSGDEQPLREHQDIGGRILPMAPYGQGASLEGDEGFTGFLGDQRSTQQDQPETKLLQQTAAVDRSGSGEQPVESMLAGAQGRTGSSPPPPAPSTHSVGQGTPVVQTHDHTEPFTHVMTRSVVLNVAQSDIGQVNIRVALTNDMVHTHLSTDRPEVGQFFINGQDRLQAAFQASGLDMGQFRVDIDRQSAGRSFYHGSSPEQGQTWNQGAQGHGTKWEQGPDRQEDQRASLYGLLNVVA